MTSLRVLLLCVIGSADVSATCVGKIVNPITDICWTCIFPITIAGVKVASGEDTPNSRSLTCICKDPPRVGIPISFWEPGAATILNVLSAAHP